MVIDEGQSASLGVRVSQARYARRAEAMNKNDDCSQQLEQNRQT